MQFVYVLLICSLHMCAIIQWIVKCCSAIQSGLEAVGATVTALYGKVI